MLTVKTMLSNIRSEMILRRFMRGESTAFSHEEFQCCPGDIPGLVSYVIENSQSGRIPYFVYSDEYIGPLISAGYHSLWDGKNDVFWCISILADNPLPLYNNGCVDLVLESVYNGTHMIVLHSINILKKLLKSEQIARDLLLNGTIKTIVSRVRTSQSPHAANLMLEAVSNVIENGFEIDLVSDLYEFIVSSLDTNQSYALEALSVFAMKYPEYAASNGSYEVLKTNILKAPEPAIKALQHTGYNIQEIFPKLMQVMRNRKSNELAQVYNLVMDSVFHGNTQIPPQFISECNTIMDKSPFSCKEVTAKFIQKLIDGKYIDISAIDYNLLETVLNNQ